MSIRQKVKNTYSRLGELLIQRKLVSGEALEHALALQRSALERDKRAPKIGEILVQTKALSKKTINMILDEQKVARGEKRKLNIDVEYPSRGVVVLKPRGGLEKQTDFGLVKILEKLMDRGVFRIALNCSDLVSISSYSISSVIMYVDECRARGGDVAFYDMRAPIRAVFERLELLQFLNIKKNKSAALASLKQPAAEAPSLAEFVSSFSSKYYHLSYCSEVKKLEEETRVYYMSRQIARKSGKQACSKCKP